MSDGFWGAYGAAISKPTISIILTSVILIVNIGLIAGSNITNVYLEHDIPKLWIAPGSAASFANKLLDTHNNKILDTTPELYALAPKFRSNTEDVASIGYMKRFNELSEAIFNIVVMYNGTAYTTYDICSPRAAQSPYTFGCEMYSPHDYWYEGRFHVPRRMTARFLLDFRLAYTAENVPNYPAFNGTSDHWNWAITAGLGGSKSIGWYRYFTQQCLDTKQVFCKETVAFGGPGRLLKDVDDLVGNRVLPPADKRDLALAKAQVLFGVLQQQAAGGAISGLTCADWDLSNSQTPPFSSLYGSAGPVQFDMRACAYITGSTCPGNVCNVTQFASNSPTCGGCIAAMSFWMGDAAKAGATFTQKNLTSSSVLVKSNLFNETTQAPNANVVLGLFNAGASASCNARTNATLTTQECIPLWNSQTAATLSILKFKGETFQYEQTVNVLGSSVSVIPNANDRVIFLNQLRTMADLLTTNGRNPLTQLDSAGHNRAQRDAEWIALLSNDQAPLYESPAVDSIDRHAKRPKLADQTTDAQILRVLSTDKNDLPRAPFKILIYGGPQPALLAQKGGQCQCIPNWGGANCNIPKDPLCNCAAFDATCLGGIFASCAQYLGCAGYTNTLLLRALVAVQAPSMSFMFDFVEEKFKIGAAFSKKALQASLTLSAQCKRFAACVDVRSNFSVSIDAPTWKLDAGYEKILDDAAYVSATFSDLATSPSEPYIARASLHLAAAAVRVSQGATDVQLNVLYLAGQGDGITLGAGDHLLLGGCQQAGGFASNPTAPACAANLTTTLTTTACNATSVLNKCPNTCLRNGGVGNALKAKGFFECLVEATHNGALDRNAAGIASWSNLNNDPIKTGICHSGGAPVAAPEEVNPLNCKIAVAAGVLATIHDRLLPPAPILTLFGLASAAAFLDKLGYGNSLAGARPTCVQRDAFGTSLSTGLAASSAFMGNLTAASWNNNATTMRTDIDAFLVDTCNAQKLCFSTKALDSGECQSVFNNIPGITTPAGKAAVGLTLGKHLFVGKVAGACGATAFIEGGGSCWNHQDCNGRGNCSLAGAVPMTRLNSFAGLIIAASPEGIVFRLKGGISAKYRALANEPILRKWNQSLADAGAKADQIRGRRRLQPPIPIVQPTDRPKDPSIDPPYATLGFGMLTGPVASFGKTGAHVLSDRDAELITREWRRSMADIIYQFSQVNNTGTTSISSEAAEELLAAAGVTSIGFLILGYGLMVLYAQVTLISYSKDNVTLYNGSRALVGASCVIIVAISVAGGLGLTALVGIQWSAAAVQVLPYVMLGLGVDDVFVCIRTFPKYRDGVSVEQACRTGLSISGPSMFLTSVINCGVFSIGTLTGMPVVVEFAKQAAIVVATNWVTMVTLVPSLLCLDYIRQGSGRIDCLPSHKIGVAPAEMQVGKVERNLFNRWFVGWYMNKLLSPLGMVFSFACLAAFVTAGALGITTSQELGLQLIDVAPSGSVLGAALEVRDRDFSFSQFTVITGEVDMSTQAFQQDYVAMFDAINTSPHVMRGSGTAWQSAFMAWGIPSTPTYQQDVNARVCSKDNTFTSGNCGSNLGCTVITNDPSILTGKAPFYAKAQYYECLRLWINTDTLYDLLKPGLVLTQPDAPRPARTLYFSKTDAEGNKFVPFSRANVYGYGLSANQDYVDLINEMKNISATYANVKMAAVGTPIDFWEQYLNLVDVMHTAIGFSLILVFVVSGAAATLVGEGDAGFLKRLFISYWSATIATAVIAAIVYTLWGFLIWADLKISAIPAISIIMSAGIAVEFVSHLGLAFCNAAGTRKERILECMDVMMAPNLDGGITTFLGVLLLLASPFPFIIKYFFAVWALIIVLSWIYSLICLPVLLYLFGPPSYHSTSAPVYGKGAAVEDIAVKGE